MKDRSIFVTEPSLCNTEYCIGKSCEFCDNSIKDTYTITENVMKNLVFAIIDHGAGAGRKYDITNV